MVKNPIEGNYYICNETTLGTRNYPCIIQVNSYYFHEAVHAIGIVGICMYHENGNASDLRGCYSAKNNLQELSLPLLLQYRIEEFPKAFKEFLKDYLKSAIHNSE